MPHIRLQVVADHRLMAEAFARRMAREPEILVLPPRHSDSASGLDRPHVVVVDAESLGTGWPEIAERLVTSTGAAVVVLAGVDEPDDALAAARAGASAWIPSRSNADDLVDAIRAVADGHVLYPSSVLGRVLDGLRTEARGAGDKPGDRGPLASLTRREREVLGCLVQGRDGPDIAARLGVASNTVRTHTNRIFRKLGAHSRLEAVRIARSEGLTPGPERRPQREYRD